MCKGQVNFRLWYTWDGGTVRYRISPDNLSGTPMDSDWNTIARYASIADALAYIGRQHRSHLAYAIAVDAATPIEDRSDNLLSDDERARENREHVRIQRDPAGISKRDIDAICDADNTPDNPYDGPIPQSI